MAESEKSTYDELRAWARKWDHIRADAYDSLAASYTDEQRAIIARMNYAARQKRLCHERMQFPRGSTGTKPPHMIAWPEKPPE